MSNIKALDMLRDYSHLDDDKWTLETGEIIHMYGSKPNDPNAINWGEQWRKIADEIEQEIAERYMELPVDADGVPISVGDMLLKSTGALKESYGEVVGVSEDSVWFSYENNGYQSNWANLTRHVKPRTIEDVLRSVVTLCANTWKDEKSAFRFYGVDEMMRSANLTDYAEEIRGMMA